MAGLLGGQWDRGRTLADMFEAGEMVLAPGCYDALGARLVEEAGFRAAYMTGFGSAASRLGRPDVGLMSMSEMVDNARRIVEAVDIPVLADADTGYGNSINVIRTVREYEAAGVAGIHIEDQVMPKKCGHMDVKALVAPHEMASKIAAAAAARRSPDFLIVARTDARGAEGLEAALRRARRYREAGADALFVEAPQSVSEIETIAEEFPDVPLLFNYAEGGKTPAVEYDFLRELGFSLVIFPLTLLLSATKVMRAALARIKADGSPIGLLTSLTGFDEFLELIGMDEVRELERRFAEG